MATRDEIQIALRIIGEINRQARELRNDAYDVVVMNGQLDNLVADTDKRQKVINGLNGLGVNLTELNDERNSIKALAQYVLDNIPEETKF